MASNAIRNARSDTHSGYEKGEGIDGDQNANVHYDLEPAFPVSECLENKLFIIVGSQIGRVPFEALYDKFALFRSEEFGGGRVLGSSSKSDQGNGEKSLLTSYMYQYATNATTTVIKPSMRNCPRCTEE